MIYYPIIIPTLNRYEHLKRLVDSLANNTYSEYTEIVIGVDFPPSERYVEGNDKIKSYLKTVTGFKKVTVFYADTNLGQAANTARLRSYVESLGYDGFILTEDDNEFSPCFIDYMNQAMEKYKNNEKVINVCGYSPFEYKGGESIYFSRYMSGWGYGVWFKKSKLISSFFTLDYLKSVLNDYSLSLCLYRERPTLLNRIMNQVTMGEVHSDVCHVLYRFINNCYSVYPSVSLVRNYGNDGSGIHCKKIDNSIQNRSICSAKEYKIDEVEIAEKKEVSKIYSKVGAKPWYGNLLILIRYLFWRLIKIDVFKLLIRDLRK